MREVNFHTFAGNKIVTKKGSGWGVKPGEGAQTVICSAFVGNTCFTGSFTGEIHAWNGPSIGKSIKAHAAKCQALFVKGQHLYSGGADGIIIQWMPQGATLQKVKQWDINTVNSAKPEVISVCVGA